MKDIELKLISELVKNSRRSDRELAKAIGISQPTVSRVRMRLEKEGLIEYTAVPNLAKLGFEITAVTLGKRNYQKHPDVNLQKAKDFAERHPNIIFGASGNGLGYDRISISIHRNYSGYSKFIQEIQNEWEGIMNVDSFIISLKSKDIVQPLSLKHFADHLKNERYAE
ncbi:Lrp/AsnC family transcriptional regulator [Candidatus Bathyarchaeota archaeon]|nr:Lrp/AsnC family transcriptional regulator [Candidatus Bathyarchaeota archaeon]